MGPVAAADDASTHHDLPVHEVLLLMQSDHGTGLAETEARRRLERYGPNQLPRTPTAGPVRRFLRQMHNPLVYVLVVAGIVTVALGELVDAAVIFGVVVINAIVGYLQESKAESALDALRSMVQTQARVVREGRRRTIASDELVPGDLVLLEAGDKVPADLRLVSEAELQVDESALTGESEPVAKDEVVLPTATPVADRRNMTYSGTLVTAGTGAGIVVATGGATEIGEIHRLVGSARELATPLTRKLATFSAWLTAVILGLAVVTFAVGVARGEAAAEMFTAAVALAVGAIPEGLPAAVTITLAIGVSRMARRGAVIRRLPAVETLGGATVVCSDKTGTLTQNRMTVRVLWTGSSEVPVPEDGDAPDPAGRVGRGPAVVPAGRRQLQRLPADRHRRGGRGPHRDRHAVGGGQVRRPPARHAPGREPPVQLGAAAHGHHAGRPGRRSRGAHGQGGRGARARPVHPADGRGRHVRTAGRAGRPGGRRAARRTRHARAGHRRRPRTRRRRPGAPRGRGQRRGARPHRAAGDARPAPGDRAGGGDHLSYGGARTSR